jgi:hypothetical protein
MNFFILSEIKIISSSVKKDDEGSHSPRLDISSVFTKLVFELLYGFNL